MSIEAWDCATWVAFQVRIRETGFEKSDDDAGAGTDLDRNKKET
jgi:hypothetical protein